MKKEREREKNISLECVSYRGDLSSGKTNYFREFKGCRTDQMRQEVERKRKREE